MDEFLKCVMYSRLLENSRRQMVKCLEEMGELSQALCKYMCFDSSDDLAAVTDHVREEIADVSIMMEQMSLYFENLPSARKGKTCMQWKEQKLERMRVRLGIEDHGGRAEGPTKGEQTEG